MLPIRLLRQRFLPAATVMLAAGMMFVVFANLSGGPAGNSPQANTTPTEVELVTLRAAGFEPSEIIRSKGAFVLFVDDRSGKESSSLVLQRVNGERVRSPNLQRKKSEWNDVVDLSPGNYVLQDTNNPELRCQITILP